MRSKLGCYRALWLSERFRAWCSSPDGPRSGTVIGAANNRARDFGLLSALVLSGAQGDPAAGDYSAARKSRQSRWTRILYGHRRRNSLGARFRILSGSPWAHWRVNATNRQEHSGFYRAAHGRIGAIGRARELGGGTGIRINARTDPMDLDQVRQRCCKPFRILSGCMRIGAIGRARRARGLGGGTRIRVNATNRQEQSRWTWIR